MADYPPVPNKIYFSIGEVSKLCSVKQHILRYWETVFTQLQPTKRRGNRRYYTSSDIYLIRQINDLLNGQGLTVDGVKRFLAGEENQGDKRYSKQLVRQIRADLEEILAQLK